MGNLFDDVFEIDITKTAAQGQNGERLYLKVEDLNKNEQRVLGVLLTGWGTIAELAKAAFPRKTKAQANSWVRNALRRLVRARLVQKIEPGFYRASPLGKLQAERAEQRQAA